MSEKFIIIPNALQKYEITRTAETCMMDQTNQRWLAGLPQNALGTGLIITRNPTSDNPKATQKGFWGNITYDTCKQIGSNFGAIAIRWIPNTVESYETVLATICGEPCPGGGGCVKPGCWCNPDTDTCE